ncbi:MAG: ATP synthase F0 subunit B [Holosporales bacterium]|jgi:F-type H+-transporting ATPase subunit b|nr:ATP synthase F0 subunit B [Holosporales bacterium]
MFVTSIFYDVHTYLIISFILTIFLIFKFAWGKITQSLQAKIDSVRSLIDSLEKQKKDAEEQMEILKRDLEEYKKIAETSVFNAQAEAKRISEKSYIIVESIISQKQEEYKEVISKIKDSFSIELQNRIIKLIKKELIKKMKESKDDREIQNISINNSTKMIEDIVERYANNC